VVPCARTADRTDPKPHLRGPARDSEAKQVFSDSGDDYTDSALNPYAVGAEVAEARPDVSRLEVGQRVVLNPWLSCVPRGITPLCAGTASSATSAWSKDGHIDLGGLLTHAFRPDQWRQAFTVLATQQESSALEVAFNFR
jgi:threonine dehydrogenase-like Zn-dependent dehydrogenase